MCLAVPLQLKKILDSHNAIVSQGLSDFTIDISLIDNPSLGDYVLVHAGYAIEKLKQQDADAILDVLDQLEDQIADNS